MEDSAPSEGTLELYMVLMTTCPGLSVLQHENEQNFPTAQVTEVYLRTQTLGLVQLLSVCQGASQLGCWVGVLFRD